MSEVFSYQHACCAWGLTWACWEEHRKTSKIGNMLDIKFIGQVPTRSALHSSAAQHWQCLPAMSLEWTEDGSGGRTVSSPLKFKISVSQLALAICIHQLEENIWSRIDKIICTRYVFKQLPQPRLLDFASLMGYNNMWHDPSRWSWMTQKLYWYSTVCNIMINW